MEEPAPAREISAGSPVVLKLSPSLLFENLSSTHSSTQQAYVHDTGAVVVEQRGGRTLSQQVPTAAGVSVLQAKWCRFDGEEYLAVASTAGLRVFALTAGGSVNADALLFEHALETPAALTARPSGTAADVFMRGIASVDAEGLLCAGTSFGDVAVFGLRVQEGGGRGGGGGGGGGGGATFEALGSAWGLGARCLTGAHEAAITSLSTTTTHLLAADDDGVLSVWYPLVHDRPPAPVATFAQFKGQPCTSVAAHRTFAFAAFATGHIRVFDFSARTLCIEIAAHNRCINALSLQPADTHCLVASVGEDACANVWRWTPSGEMELAYSTLCADTIFTGLAYSATKREFLTVAYDTDSMQVWTYAP